MKLIRGKKVLQIEMEIHVHVKGEISTTVVGVSLTIGLGGWACFFGYFLQDLKPGTHETLTSWQVSC